MKEQATSNPNSQLVLSCIADVGASMLNNGAEVWRTQETLTIMSENLNCPQIEIYVIANGVFVSIPDVGSIQRHVPNKSPHFGIIVAINALSRDLMNKQYGVETVFKRLSQIQKMPRYNMLITTLATAIGSGCFCYMFGSTLIDALSAFSIGLVLSIFQWHIGKYQINKLVYNMCCAILIAILGIALTSVIPYTNVNKIIIGAVFPLVPGWGITMSIRDIVHGDYLSGLIHMADALLIAMSIALGIGFVWKLMLFL